MLNYLKNTRYMQYVAAVSATLSITAGTMYISWPSPTLPLLLKPNSPIGETITDEEGSWVISCYLLCGLPAAPFVAYLVENIGRKWTLEIGALFLLFPWFIIIFANAVWMLYLARSLAGLGFTIVIVVCSIYNGEIADIDIRGKLGTTFTLMKLIGTFLELGIGPFVSYTTLAIIGAVVPAIFIVIFSFMPESPHYLIKIGKFDEAKKVLIRLAAANTEESVIDKKLLDIQTTIEKEMANKPTVVNFFTKKEFRKVIFIIVGVKTLQQMSGSNAIEAYMQTIIESTDSIIPAEYASIIFGAVQFPSAILAAAVVDKLGRKPMLIGSGIGCAIALSAEGVYFFLQDYMQADVSSISWLPTTGIVVFLVSNIFGVSNLPYILLGELFASNVKGIAVSGATFYGALLAFVVSKIFNPISKAWGSYTIFWIFTGFSLAGIVFVYFFLPETKGKSFDEIQDKLNGRTKPKVVEIEKASV